MGLNPWKAAADVTDLVDQIKNTHHTRLIDSRIAVTFDESKPFLRSGKLNLGKVVKFNHLAKLWQNQRHDFCLIIPSDLWHSILNAEQRIAYIDLQLTRCEVEYLPEMVEENGKKKPIKDEWGRVQYTKQVKTDDEGNPKWRVVPLDLEVFISNVRRYGLWNEGLMEFKDAAGL